MAELRFRAVLRGGVLHEILSKTIVRGVDGLLKSPAPIPDLSCPVHEFPNFILTESMLPSEARDARAKNCGNPCGNVNQPGQEPLTVLLHPWLAACAAPAP